jgi:hypothetical protein
VSYPVNNSMDVCRAFCCWQGAATNSGRTHGRRSNKVSGKKSLQVRKLFCGTGCQVPELPDIVVYVEKLDERIRNQTLADIRVSKPFLVRSFGPPISEAMGRQEKELRRIAKGMACLVRIVVRRLPGFATRATRPTTAQGVRPEIAYSRIARYRDC